MKRWMVWAVAGMLMAPVPALAQKAFLGFGVNYWRAADDVDVDGIDESGLGWVVSLTQRDRLLAASLEIEHSPRGRGISTKPVTSPSLIVTTGEFLFVGGGIGIDYTDGEFARRPFYDLRAGVRFGALPIPVEVFGSYRYARWNRPDLGKIDTDTVTLGVRAYLPF